MLGSGTVKISPGTTLTIVQSQAGTMRAVIQGATGGNLVFDMNAQVNQTFGNVGLINVANGNVGSVDIIAAQPSYYGAITINDGLIVSFHAGNGNTFLNASSVTLSGGAANVATTLTFNDTNQTFRNFSGDAKSVVNLGRGTIAHAECRWRRLCRSDYRRGQFREGRQGQFHTLRPRQSECEHRHLHRGHGRAQHHGQRHQHSSLRGEPTPRNTSGLVC